jgi:hypothetical protein
MNEIKDNEARVNITYGGKNGDLPDPVFFQSTDGDVKNWVTEAVRAGTVPGLDAAPTADFGDFVIDRFAADATRPYNLIQVRPKTPFGFASCDHCKVCFYRALGLGCCACPTKK